MGLLVVQCWTELLNCPTLHNPMDCSMPGLPVHRQFLDFSQTHILWVGDAIQPSHPLSSPSCLTFNLSQHQCLFQMSQLFTSGGQSIWWLHSFPWRPQLQSLSDQFSIPRPSCPIWENPSFIFSLQPIYHRGLGCKSRKSRDTWSYKQVWLWCTKWSKAKANRVLPKEGTGHSKHPLLTTQELTLHMDNTR